MRHTRFLFSLTSCCSGQSREEKDPEETEEKVGLLKGGLESVVLAVPLSRNSSYLLDVYKRNCNKIKCARLRGSLDTEGKIILLLRHRAQTSLVENGQERHLDYSSVYFWLVSPADQG
ncbi:hypothetical protein CRENBAI_011115 [Crenichthys baileyi]|uniref:Uncharacterized protein n=1 Tax=Crenichthys baileyi TaxID=28760 RepID=A0AAV9SIK0_9TELE